jgi:hypothetical protein
LCLRTLLQYLGVIVSTKAKRDLPQSFSTYVDSLVEMLGVERSEAAGVIDLALDGGTATAHRNGVSLASRRARGAFFTSRAMAERLIEAGARPNPESPLADPACGAGDLLLAGAKHLPRKPTALATLKSWGSLLIGRDLDTDSVRAARLRLALLAAQLCEEDLSLSEKCVEQALPEIRVGDGRRLRYEVPLLLVLNPPFGTQIAETDWGTGRLSRAAVFATECFTALPEGSTIRAILPDVLRSGSNSRRWRNVMAELLGGVRVETWGQFDPWTDIDVFSLAAKRASGDTAPIDWWPEPPAAGLLGECFSVHVGSVVPHRDPKRGKLSPYLRARDLPLNGEHTAGQATRRHTGTRFKAPFVAIRRTSRPSISGHRLGLTLIRASEPVLVENHLIVCIPNDGTLASCRELIKQLSTDEATEMLNRRIRCRHLTVGSIKEAPFRSRK